MGRKFNTSGKGKAGEPDDYQDRDRGVEPRLIADGGDDADPRNEMTIEEELQRLKELQEKGELKTGQKEDEEKRLNLPDDTVTVNQKVDMDEENIEKVTQKYSEEMQQNELTLENRLEEEGFDLTPDEEGRKIPLTIEEAKELYSDPEVQMTVDELEEKMDFAHESHDKLSDVENPGEEPFAVRTADIDDGVEGVIEVKEDTVVVNGEGVECQIIASKDDDAPSNIEVTGKEANVDILRPSEFTKIEATGEESHVTIHDDVKNTHTMAVTNGSNMTVHGSVGEVNDVRVHRGEMEVEQKLSSYAITVNSDSREQKGVLSAKEVDAHQVGVGDLRIDNDKVYDQLRFERGGELNVEGDLKTDHLNVGGIAGRRTDRIRLDNDVNIGGDIESKEIHIGRVSNGWHDDIQISSDININGDVNTESIQGFTTYTNKNPTVESYRQKVDVSVDGDITGQEVIFNTNNSTSRSNFSSDCSVTTGDIVTTGTSKHTVDFDFDGEVSVGDIESSGYVRAKTSDFESGTINSEHGVILKSGTVETKDIQTKYSSTIQAYQNGTINGNIYVTGEDSSVSLGDCTVDGDVSSMRVNVEESIDVNGVVYGGHIRLNDGWEFSADEVYTHRVTTVRRGDGTDKINVDKMTVVGYPKDLSAAFKTEGVRTMDIDSLHLDHTKVNLSNSKYLSINEITGNGELKISSEHDIRRIRDVMGDGIELSLNYPNRNQ